MTILFSPHNDDESLFACYTIMREKPLVVVVYDGYQHQRKFNIGVNVRRNESIMAMKLLGVKVEFMGLSDDESYDPYEMETLFKKYEADKIYIPAIGKNPQHNLVSSVCSSVFKDVVRYCTYDDNLQQKGSIEVIPTDEEIELKNKCLDCYISQLKINPHHFEAVRNKSEYLE